MEPSEFHKRVVLGVELEGYTILVPDYQISRKMAFHRKGTGEKGERFTRDWSIGTEYNSRPFSTIREGLFLLKSGLRKYDQSLYDRKSPSKKRRQIFLTGGWRDRFAGTHLHVSLAGEKLSHDRARRLASSLHDHIPFLIAITANSPVWADELTDRASNRVLRGSDKYFRPVPRRSLTTRDVDEMTYNRARKRKPATLEIRATDSNIPEYVMTAAVIVKACALRFLKGGKAANRISHAAYLRARRSAAEKGCDARLCWNGRWISPGRYLDRFVWEYRKELQSMDIPHEIWATLKLLKRGINGSAVLSEAARKAHADHPQTWQRRFAKRYVRAIHSLLSGNSILDFVAGLKVDVPSLESVWLGRRRLHLSS